MVKSNLKIQLEIEDNKDKRPKRKLRVLRHKRKATPSKVKDNKDIGSNTSIAAVIVIRKTHLYTVGKKPIKATSPKVRVKKAFIIKTKASKLKTL